MANFPPFRDYLFYCLNEIIKKYELKPPFLDLGCGAGDFSRFLGQRGWNGKAIDSSAAAIDVAKEKLEGWPAIDVEQKSFDDESGRYRSIFLLDILEHLDDDRQALKKSTALLSSGGHLVLAVPSHPQRWGWDDDFYGHVRRYTVPEITARLHEAGFQVIEILDFTYPVFTFLRWLQLRLGKSQKEGSAAERTSQSGLAPEWQKSFASRLLIRCGVLWKPLYWLMFTFFKSCIRQGHEMIVVAQAKK